MGISIKFLGAAGTVTGSKYLVSVGERNILVDCGVFQGSSEWKTRNWHDFEQYSGKGVKEIDAILLTHAHVDHIALVPRLFRSGLSCPIFATKATTELGRIILLDYGKIQEEDAEYREKKGISSHKPPLPFYTAYDAERSLKLFKAVPFSKRVEVLPGIFATWNPMGHILGAASITLEAGSKSVTFSGDIGRYNIPILVNPHPVKMGELLLLESTYGDRLHPVKSPIDALSGIITKTAERRGAVIIPSFAVGRTQQVLFYLRQLKEMNKIPDIPVIIDSPMARDATEIYRTNPDCYDEESVSLFKSGREPFHPKKTYFIKEVAESKKLNSIHEPMIIISASGMLSGGRVLHHLYHRISSPQNTVLFVGYQAQGTKGAWVSSGAKTVRLFKEEVPIRAEIAEVSGLSAHGDRDEMLRWCKESFDLHKKAPQQVAFVHGEPEVRKAFSKTVKETLGWDGILPNYLDEFTVD